VVPQQDRGLVGELPDRHQEVARLLGHPGPARAGGDASDMDPPAADVQEEQHEDVDQAGPRPRLLGEEVARP
jgi:hypothetical protein